MQHSGLGVDLASAEAFPGPPSRAWAWLYHRHPVFLPCLYIYIGCLFLNLSPQLNCMRLTGQGKSCSPFLTLSTKWIDAVAAQKTCANELINE